MGFFSSLFGRSDGEAEQDEPRADGPAEHGPSVIGVPTRAVTIGPDQSIVVRLDDGRTEIVSSVELTVHAAARRPGSPEEIARRLAEAGWDAYALRELPDTIESLRPKRLIGDFDTWLASYAEYDAESPAEITCFAWPTRDRPAMLARALSSWTEHLGERAPVDLVIADDSFEHAADARAVVEKHAKQYPGRVLFLDAQFRQRLVDRLAVVDRETVEWLTASDRSEAHFYGANRNRVLLALAGRAFATTDDDMIPVFSSFPDAAPGLAVDGTKDVSRFIPTAEPDELRDAGVPWTGDIRDVHHRYLGRPCRELITTDGPLELAPVDEAFVSRFLSRESRVAAMSLCYVGDTGNAAPQYLLSSRTRMIDRNFDADRYEKLAASTDSFWGFHRATIGKGVFTGGHFSLDARRVLPPFSPRGRGEDTCWSTCLSVLHPHMTIAFPTVSIEHSRETRRIVSSEDLLRWIPRLNDLLVLALHLLAGECSPGDDRYSIAGSRLAALAEGPRPTFRSALAELAAHATTGRIALLSAAYEQFDGQPENWGLDCISAIEFSRAQLEKKDFWLPPDAPGGEDEVAEYIARFGRALSAWPALFAEAASLGDELLADTVVR